MNINDEMKTYFSSQEIEKVFSDEKLFKEKLGLDDKAYAKLNIVKNLDKYGSSVLAGLATSGGGYLAWYLSLGTFAKIGLAFGLVSNPGGWIALASAGGVGAILMYGGKKALESIDKAAYDKTPKYLNTPLDLLGTSLMDIIMPLVIKISHIENKVDKPLLNTIVEHFIELGYDKNYIEQSINATLKSFQGLEISDTSKKLKVIAKKTDGLKYEKLSTLFQELLNSIFDKKTDKSNFRDLNDILKNL